ncbi:hypothetical protein QMK33_16275 [Hymenobacter sp. H14-R3]|uniref:hypothetical protein n=1 Tax=Hymenobacter sp. H14-R3 TaxID=3046308 RepID=UPI0024BA9AE8|nr:hypothetical protein [Hymenobacter sp. H14-R3]MDJ0366715.1 hypothetical protein [Hymenobacter sp. H14-R3]
MKLAVGTSLAIIALSSLTSFISDLSAGTPIAGPFILGFLAFALGGIVRAKLKPAFGWFTLAMSTLLGIILAKREVISWFRVQEIFRFQAFHVYGVIGSAIVVGMGSIQLLKRNRLKPTSAEPILLADKQFNHGIWLGGFIFGLSHYRTRAAGAACLVASSPALLLARLTSLRDENHQRRAHCAGRQVVQSRHLDCTFFAPRAGRGPRRGRAGPEGGGWLRPLLPARRNEFPAQ